MITALTAKPQPTPRPSVAAESFADLQRRMAALELRRRAGLERSLVVVPSRSVDKWHEPPAESRAYEERLLCTLLELRDPRLRLTYVTSAAVHREIVAYYLSLLPPRIRRHARSRLSLIAIGERGGGSLSQKLLARPGVLERIRRTIPDLDTCHLVPYSTTERERDVALALGIPMYGADPRLGYLGTKSGCRQLFAHAGVPHPAGAEAISSPAELVDAIVRLRATAPDLARVVVKLNEGVSGEGNAVVELSGLRAPGEGDEREQVAERVWALSPEAPGIAAADYLVKLARQGGIVEEWITGSDLQSPSVQLQITPLGEVHVVSTHDQILGGAGGQSYLGCRFPAHPSYAPAISALARRVGARLAELGVIGRCAIDFVVTRNGSNRWRPYAIELNLRKGGTTHPYETLAHLTGGGYDADTATFISRVGRPKHYLATDHLEAPELRSLGRDGVLAAAGSPGLRFDPLTGTGAVFHMVSSVDELGRTGYTAIADSAEEAQALSARVEAKLLARGRAAVARPGPGRAASTRTVAGSGTAAAAGH